jgi:hypothetical protein
MASEVSPNTDFKPFLFKYFHDGSWWRLEIQATSMDDAQARIKKLPHAQLLGESIMKLPANCGIIARCLCWLRNSWVSVRSAR